jgi:dTDP-glucose 4,6-dehydratase
MRQARRPATSWHQTYGLPTTTTLCSNNYGPRQYPEKLIPLLVARAMAGRPLPIYGDGLHRRDWLHVLDHCSAIRLVIEHAAPGSVYHVGAGNERTTLQVAHAVCAALDDLRPDPAGPHARLISHVADRPGHDRRYALDAGRIACDLGWRPAREFESGLRETVAWYLDHPSWLARCAEPTRS